MISESTVMSGLGARDPVLVEELVVVLDDPVVDPDHRAVADRVVVGGEAGVALRVVAHVHEQLRRLLGHADPVEQGGRAGALLVQRDRGAGLPERVADGVGATLGDPGEERAGSDSPLDPAVEARGYIRRFRTKSLSKRKRPCGRSILLDASAVRPC